MDSDRDSGQFRGDASSGQSKRIKTLPLTVLLLLILIVADASNASSLSKHRFLIDDPPKVNSDTSTSPPPSKETPVTSPPPPAKPDSNATLTVEHVKNKTVSAPPAKTPDPILDPNNSTKPVLVSPPTDAGEVKNNHTQKTDPNAEPKEKPTTPVPDQKPKEKEKPAPETDKKLNPAPVEDPKAKRLDNATGSAGPPPPPPPPPVEGGEVKNNVTNVPGLGGDSCDGVIKTCSNADMVACIKRFDKESTEAVILVQNVRDSRLKGSISAEDTKVLNIPKHQYKKIKLNMGQSKKVVLKAGNGECVLQIDSFVSEGNFFMRFPSYEQLVTPINGAYLLIVTVIIFGGMWACCLVRRRKQRTGGGVPYQELEMALPESASATEVVTAEGWDQGWDDDWDGDNAVKSPGGHLVGSISANGLTARSSNKDGWENNWDD